MSSLAELMSKTQLRVRGIVKEIEAYPSKKEPGLMWYSIHVEVQGCKGTMKLNCPKNYNIGAVKQYEIADFSIRFQPSFNGKYTEYHINA